MKKLLKLSGIAFLSAMAFTACDEDDNPVDDQPGDTTAVYISFEQNSYWVYESKTYDDPNEEDKTERDSTVITSTEDHDGREAYEYTTWTEVEGSYESEPSSVEYYSENEGDIYLHASSINDRLATEEIKAIIDFSIPDGWLLIRDNDDSSTRVLQEVMIDESPISVGGVTATIKNGKLLIQAKTEGEEDVEQPSGNKISSQKTVVTFTLSGDVESNVADGQLDGSTTYTIWTADGQGITKTDFKPFKATVTTDISNFDLYSAPGTESVLIRSQVSADNQ